MLKRLRMMHKLLSAFLLVGLIPLATIGIIAFNSATNALQSEIFALLEGLRDSRRDQLMDFFNSRLIDIQGLVNNPFYVNAAGGLWTGYTVSGLEGRVYQLQHERNRPQLAAFAASYGYSDMLMVGPEGTLYFTLNAPSILGQNVLNGPLSETHFGRAVRRLLTTGTEWALTDFAPFEPAGGEIVSFLVHRLPLAEGSESAVIALQLPITPVQLLMQSTTGLGNTGETYLVGPDMLMRTDSRFSQTSTTLTQRVDTAAVRAAQAGETGSQLLVDYRGRRVLSSYTPVSILDQLQWVLVAEMEEAEAFAPVRTLATQMLGIGGLSLALVIVVGVLLSRAITRPVSSMVSLAQRVAEGDLTQKLEVTTHDEIGDLGTAINTMVENLKRLIGEISDSSRMLGSATTELQNSGVQAAAASHRIAQVIQNLAEGAASQSRAAQESSSSMEELRASISNIAQGAQNQAERVAKTVDVIRSMVTAVDQVASTAEEVAESSQTSFEIAQQGGNAVRETIAGMERIRESSARVQKDIEELGKQSQRIGEIVTMIDEIADQTNLLALNAAIEAARAGEHGRGFAVVAEEVRKLAERSGAAANDITDLVASIQEGVQRAVQATQAGAGEIERGTRLAQQSEGALEKILEAMENVTRQVRSIAQTAQNVARQAQDALSAVDEVASITEENTAATEEMAATSDQVVEAISQVATISEQTATASQEASSSVEEVAASMQQMSRTAQELSEMARELERMVARFKLS